MNAHQRKKNAKAFIAELKACCDDEKVSSLLEAADDLRKLSHENEQLRQRVAELEKERDEEIARNRPLRNLIASLEEQKLHWNKQRDEYREAVSTMDSERSANATLTAERDELLAAAKLVLGNASLDEGFTALTEAVRKCEGEAK